MATDSFAGPVDYLVFSFPESAPVGAGLQAVLDRVRAGDIEILDLEVVALDSDGRPRVLALEDLADTGGVDLTSFVGVSSGILDQDDLSVIAADLHSGFFALVIVYEDRSLAMAAAAFAHAGGTEVLAGGIVISDLDTALEGS